MTYVTNERLAAYADGELDEADMAQVREALASDELLRARLARIETIDDRLRSAFAPGYEEEIPLRLAELLDVQPQRRTWFPAGMRLAGSAVAAGVAGVVIGALWSEAPVVSPSGEIAFSPDVSRAIDRTPSGSRAIVGNTAVEPVLSFASNDGRVCRELRIELADAARQVVACRVDAAWRIEALVSRPKKPAGGYVPAGASDGGAIEAAETRLGFKQAMSAAEEDAAIAKKWR
jgi:anti-sigma factor RsiW